MTVIESGTVLITGPTRGMGRALTLERAGRPAPHRPDLLLVGRPAAARDLLAAGAVRPLRALVANAGVMTADPRVASADGYEMTFAVDYLAHAQLIGDLLGSFTAPARRLLLGSATSADRPCLAVGQTHRQS